MQGNALALLQVGWLGHDMVQTPTEAVRNCAFSTQLLQVLLQHPIWRTCAVRASSACSGDVHKKVQKGHASHRGSSVRVNTSHNTTLGLRFARERICVTASQQQTAYGMQHAQGSSGHRARASAQLGMRLLMLNTDWGVRYIIQDVGSVQITLL